MEMILVKKRATALRHVKSCMRLSVEAKVEKWLRVKRRVTVVFCRMFR